MYSWRRKCRATVRRHIRWRRFALAFAETKVAGNRRNRFCLSNGLNGPVGRNASADCPMWRADNPRPKYRRSCSLRPFIFQTINDAVPLDSAGPGWTPRNPQSRRLHSSKSRIRSVSSSLFLVHIDAWSVSRLSDAAGTASSSVVSVPRYRRTISNFRIREIGQAKLKQSIDLKVAPRLHSGRAPPRRPDTRKTGGYPPSRHLSDGFKRMIRRRG